MILILKFFYTCMIEGTIFQSTLQTKMVFSPHYFTCQSYNEILSRLIACLQSFYESEVPFLFIIIIDYSIQISIGLIPGPSRRF